MTRLLIVSRSAALAQRLRDVHEVVEHPVERVGELAETGPGDILVLDLGDPDAALRALESVRARGSRAPALIVSGYQPAWANLVERDLPGVIVVPLPITRQALLSGIEQLAGAVPPAAPAVVDQAPAEQAPAEQAPAEQAPAEQAPAEQAPLDQAPLEDAALGLAAAGQATVTAGSATAPDGGDEAVAADAPGHTAWQRQTPSSARPWPMPSADRVVPPFPVGTAPLQAIPVPVVQPTVEADPFGPTVPVVAEPFRPVPIVAEPTGPVPVVVAGPSVTGAGPETGFPAPGELPVAAAYPLAGPPEPPTPLPSRPVGRSLAPELRASTAADAHPTDPEPAVQQPSAQWPADPAPREAAQGATGFDADADADAGDPADDWAEPAIERPGWVQPGWAQPPTFPRASGSRHLPSFGEPVDRTFGFAAPARDGGLSDLWPPAEPDAPTADAQQPPPMPPGWGRQDVPVVDSVLLPVDVDPRERLPEDPNAPTADDLFPSRQRPFSPGEHPAAGRAPAPPPMAPPPSPQAGPWPPMAPPAPPGGTPAVPDARPSDGPPSPADPDAGASAGPGPRSRPDPEAAWPPPPEDWPTLGAPRRDRQTRGPEPVTEESSADDLVADDLVADEPAAGTVGSAMPGPDAAQQPDAVQQPDAAQQPGSVQQRDSPPQAGSVQRSDAPYQPDAWQQPAAGRARRWRGPVPPEPAEGSWTGPTEPGVPEPGGHDGPAAPTWPARAPAAGAWPGPEQEPGGWPPPAPPGQSGHTEGAPPAPPWGTPPTGAPEQPWNVPAAGAYLPPGDTAAADADTPAPIGWPLAGSEPAPWSGPSDPRPGYRPAGFPPDSGPSGPAFGQQPPFTADPEPAEDPAAAIARRRALLGRGSGHGGGSALLRRLGGRKYATSLGPGGTSAELIALGSGHPVADPRTGPAATPHAGHPGHTGQRDADDFAAAAGAFGVAPPVAPPGSDRFGSAMPPPLLGMPEPPAPGGPPAPAVVPTVTPADASYPPIPPPLLGGPEPADYPPPYASPPAATAPSPAAASYPPPAPVVASYPPPAPVVAPYPPVHPAGAPDRPAYSPAPPAPADQAAAPYPLPGGSPGAGPATEPAVPVHDPTVAPAEGDLAELLAALARRSGELFGVCDTAQVLAEDLVDRAGADAAAVLVPDGPVWRVSGWVGLLPLEQRILLDASHWLVTEIALGGQVLLLQDTALARPKLAGAPLATWRHLLAIPVPQVRAVVMLARGPGAQPFGEADLAQVVGPVSEATGLLSTAIRTRQLARLLAPLREDDPDLTS